MATGSSSNAAIETFRKHSAELLKVIQNPEVFAWDLYTKGMITSTAVDEVRTPIMSNHGYYSCFVF